MKKRILSLVLVCSLLMGMIGILPASAATVGAKADNMTAGQQYLIVSNDYALTYDRGLKSTEFTTSMEAADKLLWTAESTSGGFKLKNGDNYLRVTVTSSWYSTTVNFESTTNASNGSVWAYNEQYLTTSISNTTYYLYCSSDRNTFKASNSVSGTASRNVELYTVSTGGGTVTPPPSDSETKTATIALSKSDNAETENYIEETIQVGSTLTLTLENPSRADKAISANQTDSTVASISPSNFNILGTQNNGNKDGTQTITITGLKAGNTNITFSGQNTEESGDPGSMYYATVKLTVTGSGTVTPPTGGGNQGDNTGSGHNIGFTSDVHSKTTDFKTWFEAVNNNFNPDLEVVGFGGDFADSGNQSAGVIDTLKSTLGSTPGIFTYGNHEYYSGTASHPNLKKVGIADTSDAYDIFCFGASAMYTGEHTFSESDVSALRTYLQNDAPTDQPIFILSHFPLHYYSNGYTTRYASNATEVIQLLNGYPNVIFLWGHNHSMNDPDYGKVTDRTGSIKYGSRSTMDIDFIYASNGAIKNGAGNDIYGLVANVSADSKTVTLTYTNLNGVTQGTPKKITITEGTTPPATKTLSSIAVTNAPNKTSYVEGNTFDPTGMTVTATYSDNSTKAVTNYTISGDLTPGKQIPIIISYTEGGETKTARQYISVAPKAPTLGVTAPTTLGGDGEITGTSTAMEYSTSENFTSNTTKNCTANVTKVKAGTYYVRVKETSSVPAGAAAPVTVPEGTAATVTAIAVSSTNHKTTYKVGETLDVSNLKIRVTMSYGNPAIVDVTADMVSGFSSSAVAASKTLTITYQGQTCTYNVKIEKADGPDAPKDLNPVAPTQLGGSDGKITGTTTAMEYSSNADFSNAKACSGTAITGLKAGTYYVRVKATDTHNAGSAATVTVPDGAAATVDSIEVSSNNHKTTYKVGETLDVSHLKIRVTMSYGNPAIVDVTADMVSGFDSSAVASSKTLTITYQGKTCTYNVKIEKADGPAAPKDLNPVAPTNKDGNNGKITGVDTTMEYKLSTADTYTACTGTEITGLSAGTYLVRVKVADSEKQNVGADATVIIPGVTAIEVSSTDHKTAYVVGDTLDVSKLKINVTLSDETVKSNVVVTADMVDDFVNTNPVKEQTLTITYQGATTTYKISIAPQAPTATAVAPSYKDAADGKITITSTIPAAGLEYKLNTAAAYSAVTGTEITGLSAGTYLLRVKATETTPASADTTVTINAGPAVGKIEVSGKNTYVVDDTLNKADLTIKVYVGTSTTPVAEIKGDTTGVTIEGFDSDTATKKQTLTVKFQNKSDTFDISIAPKAPTGLTPVAPTTVEGEDGQIKGTTTAMEYSTKTNFSDAKNCSNNATTGLKYGTYYVRVKETNTAPASDYVTVNVPPANVESIRVISTSHKTTYMVGDPLDVSNLVILATLDNGKTQAVDVTADMVTGFNSTAVDNSLVLTITYGGKTTTYTVKIIAEYPNPFVDVDEDDWFYDEVLYAYYNGLMNGVGGNMFDPNGTTNRAMIVTILYRLEGEPSTPSFNPFSDVANGEWYTKAIIWAAQNGIVNGIGEGKFAPTQSITREQMAAILYRYADYKDYDTSAAHDTNILSYKDYASISKYAVEAMQWACGEGLITGMTKDTLAPKGGAIRAQSATILARFCETVAK